MNYSVASEEAEELFAFGFPWFGDRAGRLAGFAAPAVLSSAFDLVQSIRDLLHRPLDRYRRCAAGAFYLLDLFAEFRDFLGDGRNGFAGAPFGVLDPARQTLDAFEDRLDRGRRRRQGRSRDPNSRRPG